MTGQNQTKLNQLLKDLPDGLVVDAAWLEERGYSRTLRNQYVAAGWLEQPTRRVFKRPGKPIGWEQLIVSFQTLLDLPLVVGGRTALELQGFGHYATGKANEIFLYGPKRPPTWAGEALPDVQLVYRNSVRLFAHDTSGEIVPLARATDGLDDAAHTRSDFKRLQWGRWDWPLVVSTPERAILELLDELPDRESFHQVDVLMEGLSSLSPRRLNRLLADCTSVKVKRLFFFFADRHTHRWRNQVNPEQFDLGSGKRVLVRDGKLNKRYLITVPDGLDGLR